ncbi:MAG: PaaI family thioesterase [Haloarculaceae archaeon]
MGDDSTNGEGGIDAQTEMTRLESVEQYLEYLRESNPYYEWLGPEVDTVERGYVRVRQPYSERVEPPELGPSTGINGGVLLTLADAVGMAAVVAQALEPVPLATTNASLSFHDGRDEAYYVEGEVIEVGSTLATARVRALPESEEGAEDPTLVATGEVTARLFD